MKSPSSAPAPSPTPDPFRRRRERLGGFVVVMLLAVGAAGGWLLKERARAEAMVAREDGARAVLERVYAAEGRFHEQHGRYGWVDELAAAGLLDGLDLVETNGRRAVVAHDYQIDVLLPSSRVGPQAVAWTPQGGRPAADPDLQTRHVAVVARPVVPRVSGFRIWYLDERGELYLNEGVVDDEAAELNPLPATQVIRSERLDTANWLLWQRESDVVRGDED